MANFVTDNTPLPPAKADAYPPVNPAQEVDAADINTIWGALGDVRTELGVVPSVTTITGPGTKNIVRGSAANSAASDVGGSTVAGGGSTSFPNKIGSVAASNASVATIGGGYDNRNNMLAGTIAGGAHHFLDGSAGGDHAVIAGGSINSITTSGHYASIGGGNSNVISGAGNGGHISGGISNTVTNSATISGGSLNTAGADGATISGGTSNQCDANATAGTIGGGTQNQITGTGAIYDTIAGGTQNHVTGTSYGTIGGGLSNTVTGQFAVVAGGTASTASGAQSVVSGGNGNTASGTRTAVLSGASNTAQTGDSACVINGQQNTASGSYSTVRGLRGTAPNYGQHTIASGFFAVAGDAQVWEAVLRGTTTDATLTSLTLDGASQIPIPDNTTFAFRITVAGRRTDASDNAAYEVKGLIKRDVGVATTAIVGTVATTILAESDATWDSTAVADTVNGRLTVRVIGAAGKTIRWVAHIRVVQVSQ